MKYFYLISIILLMSFQGNAQNKPGEIAQAAETIIKAKAENTDFALVNYRALHVDPVQKQEGKIDYWIVNFDPKGFVILSGNENLFPLVAYGFRNNCPNDPEAGNFQSWMDGISAQAKYVRDHDCKADSKIQSAWDNIHNPDYWKSSKEAGGEPMLQTEWDQGKYYNASCPEDPAGPDGHALTGCVATALGQLMNYFRYPNQGTGYYSYTDPNYGYLEMDFSEQSYNWDAMGSKLSDYNPDVADLLHHIGISVDMQYGPDGSGMTNHKGAYTLYTYFGYADSTTYLFRDSLDESFDWSGMLIDHLDQNIPLYYAGWSDTVYQSGHAFIVDAYQDSTYFHFNWGWGGNSDGYFNINSLTPSGADFTLLHEAIANAVPKTETPDLCQGLKVLNNMQGTINDGSGPLHNYGNNQNCEWLIQTDDSVSYIEFNLLACAVQPGDELIIFDGPDETSPVLTSFSGNEDAQEFESTSDKVLVRFLSDDQDVDEGWSLAYKAVRPDYCELMTTLTDSAATISDGSNDFLYLNNTYCNWYLQPEGARNFRINFNEFDIEDGDYLRIIDVTHNQLIATLSGNQIPESLDVSTDHLSITFDSDNSGRAQGFELSYSINVSAIDNYMKFDRCEIAPNPAENMTYLHIELKEEGELVLNLIDISGKLLNQKRVETIPGENKIEIPLNGLHEGLYLLEIQSENRKEVRKIQVR